MPRKHKRKRDSRKYLSFSQGDLDSALHAVKCNNMSMREASIQFNIPRSTLKRRMVKTTPNKPGRKTVLTSEMEKIIVDRISVMCDWGFPLDGLDLRHLVQNILNVKGVVEPRFKNNLPSKEFVYSFLNRFPELTKRFAGNIKRSRAALTHEAVDEYFNNLKQSLEGIPPECIYNYDESNLQDDPGKKLSIVKRGVKYPERIINSSKSATSIMVCGTAAGQVLPIHVVYKSLNVYHNWIQGGPDGTIYSCSKSGWFDGEIFEEWFRKILLPDAKKKNGPKAIIGDNLSSHFSLEVIKLCEKNNIKFICLPPNSTDKTQPLDIAYFGPLKTYWRSILREWKESNRKEKGIPKSIFPSLLKNLMTKVNETGGHNVRAGFEKAGIYPFNPQKVHNKIPNEEPESPARIVDASLIQLLKESSGRNNPTKSVTKKCRGKKIEVAPGKSVSAEKYLKANDSDEVEEIVAIKKKDKSKVKKKVKRKIFQEELSETDEDEMEVDNMLKEIKAADSDLELSFEESENSEDEKDAEYKGCKKPKFGNVKSSDWVVVRYELPSNSKANTVKEKLYIGQVIKAISRSVFFVKFVRPEFSFSRFKYTWPEADDEDHIDFKNIVYILHEPQSTRGFAAVFQF